MKSLVQKLLIPVFFLLALPASLLAQDLTGIWKGTFQTDGGDAYRLEFQVAQNKNNTVTGVSYSYGESTRFYGKATMTGHYTADGKSFLIQETKTVELKMASGSCLMNYRFTYSRSGNEEYLEGTYLGKTEDRNNPANNGTWGDCGVGKVFLRRVQQSDFYVEPFLRDRMKAQPNTARPPVRTPQKPPVRTAPKPRTQTPAHPQKPVTPPPVNKPINKPALDTTRRVTAPIVNTKPVEHPAISIPATTRARHNELAQTLVVSNEEVHVRLYDNGEVDGDSISVYLDGKLIVSNKGLSTVPISFTVKLDENSPEHTLVMVAENMGRIPPNTSLMIVQDGDRRYEVGITSTEQKNAMVRFRYQKQ